MAERILVIGSPGSGKSTLARQLGERTGLPVHHLDQLYWRPGWVEPDAETWHAQVRALAARPRWIIDGTYAGTLPVRLAAADTVVLLDLSPLRCFWRVIRRILGHLGKVRPDMAEGCPERFDLGFLGYVLLFRLRTLPRVEAMLEGYSGPFAWLGNRREIADFLKDFRGS